MSDTQAPSDEPRGIHLKVLSYNIHKGFTATNRQMVLEQIRQSIRQTDADLVFLQEVIGEHKTYPTAIKNYPTASQFEYLADGVWSHFAYGKNAVYDEGHHGNALLSKYPIEYSNNLNISTNSWESRGLLHAKIRVSPTKSFHAFASHLSLLGDGRRLQIDIISRYIQQQAGDDEAIILAGDFNDWRKKVSHALQSQLGLEEVHRRLHGVYAVTFPSRMPVLSLDRIYFRGFDALDARALGGGLWSRLSDHLALYGEFRF